MICPPSHSWSLDLHYRSPPMAVPAYIVQAKLHVPKTYPLHNSKVSTSRHCDVSRATVQVVMYFINYMMYHSDNYTCLINIINSQNKKI